MEICDSAVLHNDIFINGKRHYIFYSGAHLFYQHASKKNGIPFGIPFFLSFGGADLGFEPIEPFYTAHFFTFPTLNNN